MELDNIVDTWLEPDDVPTANGAKRKIMRQETTKIHGHLRSNDITLS
jgi:hypothetical protein